MADVKAYAINAIKFGKETTPASTKERPSIFNTDKKTFDTLVAQKAVREPTKEELALFKAQQEAAGNGEEIETVDQSNGQSSDEDKDAKQPASGAKGDPKGTPKGAAKSDDLGV